MSRGQQNHVVKSGYHCKRTSNLKAVWQQSKQKYCYIEIRLIISFPSAINENNKSPMNHKCNNQNTTSVCAIYISYENVMCTSSLMQNFEKLLGACLHYMALIILL